MFECEIIDDFGFPEFITKRHNINGNFRPCATSFYKNNFSDYKVKSEWQEIKDADNSYKNIINWKSEFTTPFIFRPYRMRPSLWNRKEKRDFDWYFSSDDRYLSFIGWDNNEYLIPAAISVVLPFNEGLSWVTYSGYAHDENFQLAKKKSLLELIERDDFMAWWHKNLSIDLIDTNNSRNCSELINSIHNNPSVYDCQLYSIPNEWNVFTMMTVIRLNVYPYTVFGLGSSESAEFSAQHSILEAVNSVKGLDWSATHGDLDYCDRSAKVLKKLKETVTPNKRQILNTKHDMNFYQLQKRTKTYFTKISSHDGYTVKGFSMLLQPEILIDTAPFMDRLIMRTEHPLIREISPFV